MNPKFYIQFSYLVRILEYFEDKKVQNLIPILFLSDFILFICHCGKCSLHSRAVKLSQLIIDFLCNSVGVVNII